MTAVRTAFIAFLLAAADQLSKHSAAVFLKSKNAVTVFDGFLQLRYVENTGAAFGILGGKNNFLIAFTALVLIFGFAYLFFSKGRDRLFDCALLAALSGGLGNLIDRLFRHFVIDFIEFTFIDFPVFNLADCLVTAGVFIMLIKTLVDFFMQRGREERKSTKENEDDKTGKA